MKFLTAFSLGAEISMDFFVELFLLVYYSVYRATAF